MATTIKLSDELVAEARHYSAAFSRSIPKQNRILGKKSVRLPKRIQILPYSFIKDILLAQQEADDQALTPCSFGLNPLQYANSPNNDIP